MNAQECHHEGSFADLNEKEKKSDGHPVHQGTLTEGKGSVQLTSSLGYLVF